MKLQEYVQNKPKLETDRLLLRPLQYDDVADLKNGQATDHYINIGGNVPEKVT